MADKWSGDFLSSADIKEIEEEKKVLMERKQKMHQAALCRVKLAEARRIRMSLTESSNQPTDGSPIKYTLEELKANRASNVVQVKENPEQMEFKNEDKTKNIE